MSGRPDGARRRLSTYAIGTAVVIAAVTGLLWYLSDRGDEATRLAASADRNDRLEAIHRLRRRGGPAAREALLRLARDDDTRVAVAATWAIGAMDESACRDLLAGILADTSFAAEVRAEAAAAYGKRPGAEPGVLTRALSTDPDPQARTGAAKGLLLLKEPKTIPALVEALEDGDAEVRRWALQAIHSMVVPRFSFRPELPPERQRDRIEAIKAGLRKCGVL
jgi:HEAT repeat protein